MRFAKTIRQEEDAMRLAMSSMIRRCSIASLVGIGLLVATNLAFAQGCLDECAIIQGNCHECVKDRSCVNTRASCDAANAKCVASCRKTNKPSWK